MVYRVYVEKKKGLDREAAALLADVRDFLGVTGLTGVRVLERYDVEGVSRALFDEAVKTVFSDPRVDTASEELPAAGGRVFAVEYLPGQFDQRADSAAQCIQIMSRLERPRVRTARVYLLSGRLDDRAVAAVKRYVINPVEAREASLERLDTLQEECAPPAEVGTLAGFRALREEELAGFLARYGLAMDADDLAFCRDYFVREGRDPTVAELRVVDTYWSDHCRHTTFLTTIDGAEFDDESARRSFGAYLAARERLGRAGPVNLMDVATLAARVLRAGGKLPGLDESEEINACTVRLPVEVDGREEPWLLLFKNETHNHPTEIEPFGGAATCIGGAIRDPLSGRGYVYGAMRLTGAADPRKPVGETLPGKLPQRKIVTAAAAGYSSYGNQIGLATGLVDELYHPGYEAKRMEIGAVVAAVPAENVRRERPQSGDVVLLLGGRTGRDGCGGATGSSKPHTVRSLESCGAEVQKGNAPEERKLQRLFRNAQAARMIRRCNDFGAGGVSVAVGELADGLAIDLNAVPRKYEGLDGTELAISESQERMAVVVAPEDAERFAALAREEDLEAAVVARVTAEPRLTMDWNGKRIVDLSREFLGSNGAEKHVRVRVKAPEARRDRAVGDFRAEYLRLASDLSFCSRRGLGERFDATVGAGTVLMPFGGRRQLTPIQAMAQKLPVLRGRTDDCSLMAWGFDPYISERSPYRGAYLAVTESVSRLIATGAGSGDIYLTLQEYFPRPGRDPERWGLPLAALLGAFQAQMDLGVAAIGGKDSMSGSFEELDVPPTLVSFAVTADKAAHVVSPEFKRAGDRAVLLRAREDRGGLPEARSLKEVFRRVTALLREKKVSACWALGRGGVAEAVLKMCLGNGFGFRFADGVTAEEIFAPRAGAFLLETSEDVPGAWTLGAVTEDAAVSLGGESLPLAELQDAWEGTLESVYPTRPAARYAGRVETYSHTAESVAAPAVRTARPRVLIPVFPGTNCEYDSARAVEEAGAEAGVFVVNNLTAADVERSVERFAREVAGSQAVFIPGGFSGGDEPDGSGKLIAAFFRSPAVKERVTELLERRDGLMLGVCNGFQALVRLGLVPFGRIAEPSEDAPTLTFNAIGRHQSRIVRVRVASDASPWLRGVRVGEVYQIPVSHGEGRFLCAPELLEALARRGQIAAQYVDPDGAATQDIRFNPNGSAGAVEGLLSPDGRVLGRMGHSERVGPGLYRNVPGRYDMRLFSSAVAYFRG